MRPIRFWIILAAAFCLAFEANADSWDSMEAAGKFSKTGNHGRAIEIYRNLASDPDQATAAFASIYLAEELNDAGKQDEALAFCHKTLKTPTPSWPSGSPDEDWLRAKNTCASLISKIEEQRGNIPQALKWAKLTATKYKYRNFCGLAADGEEEMWSARIASLQAKMAAPRATISSLSPASPEIKRTNLQENEPAFLLAVKKHIPASALMAGIWVNQWKTDAQVFVRQEDGFRVYFFAQKKGRWRLYGKSDISPG